jgi:hypothetical protein
MHCLSALAVALILVLAGGKPAGAVLQDLDRERFFQTKNR